MKFLVASALAALASAACPNACSGHGTCSKSDLCTCYDQWSGADCSQRKCPEDRAWATSGSDVHAYVECAGQGVCNRATGECECFDGFTGRACARSTCPNDCSGHGVCKLLSEVQTAIPYDASNWDAKRIQTCECDAGFFGSDCSLRRCPTGDDPLTLCQSDQFNHIQEVRFTLGSLTKYEASSASPSNTFSDNDQQMAVFPTSKSQLRVSYVDSFGGAYVAHPVDVVLSSDATDPALTDDIKAERSLELALETLPNKKVGDVKVQSKATKILNADGSLNTNGVFAGTSTAIPTAGNFIPQRAWTVTFLGDKTNSNNVGLQNSLMCDTAYSCTEDGCQPKVTMPFLYRYAATDAVYAQTAITSGASTKILNYSGDLAGTGANRMGNTRDQYKYIELHPDTQPQMPLGVAVDTEATRVGTSSFQRYDIAVRIAVVDGDQNDGINNGVDSYYTKVIFGHNNITASTEAVNSINVWKPNNVATPWTGFSLNGYTYNGPIPAGLNQVPVPGAPGIFINFPSRDMVSDTKGQWFEILIKLPNCEVTPVTATGAAVRDLTTFGTIKPQIDANVENIECGGRGQCNRKSGQCECYEGYYGLSCSKQTTLV